MNKSRVESCGEKKNYYPEYDLKLQFESGLMLSVFSLEFK